jgi:putative PIN family toxin of toxin-antitoxin system
MRLIVLDTNVLVAARINSEGAPSKVVNLVLNGSVQAVTCRAVSTEYREVTTRAKFHRYGFPPLWLELLIEKSLVLPDPVAWPHSCPDPGDIPFLALAHAASAWLVTGNLKHYPEPVREGVVVLSPVDYLAKVAGVFLA